MNAYALARYETAMSRLDDTIERLDGSMETAARHQLLGIRGDLQAMRQLLDMEETLAARREAEAADTERPKLTVVK